jgi:hypothetical protein
VAPAGRHETVKPEPAAGARQCRLAPNWHGQAGTDRPDGRSHGRTPFDTARQLPLPVAVHGNCCPVPCQWAVEHLITSQRPQPSSPPASFSSHTALPWHCNGSHFIISSSSHDAALHHSSAGGAGFAGATGSGGDRPRWRTVPNPPIAIGFLCACAMGIAAFAGRVCSVPRRVRSVSNIECLSVHSRNILPRQAAAAVSLACQAAMAGGPGLTATVVPRGGSGTEVAPQCNGSADCLLQCVQCQCRPCGADLEVITETEVTEYTSVQPEYYSLSMYSTQNFTQAVYKAVWFILPQCTLQYCNNSVLQLL